jgi:hypothetical protein
MLTRSIAEIISRSMVRGSMHDSDSSSVVTKWLVTDREFNAWFLAEVKKSDDDDALLAVVAAYGEDQERIERAWDDYREAQELAPLIAKLRESIERMQEIRSWWTERR